MTTTRAAAKRAAMDDAKDECMITDSGRSKRPALANISNDTNKPAAGTSKAVATFDVGAPSKPNRKVANLKSSTSKGSAITRASSSSTPQERNAQTSVPPNSDMGTQSIQQENTAARNEAAIASLERWTNRNLRISSTPQSKDGQGRRMFVSKSPSEPERKPRPCNLGYTSIDNNASDPQMCNVYAGDIYDNLRISELKRRPSTAFMESIQRDVNPGMRGILMDWLVEVAEEYKLVPDTLYLTCSYIDRFLSSNLVSRSRLQLLGVSCMLIASKYEEIYSPQIEEFCYITDNTYQKQDVIDMEKKVLNNLQFELSTPTTKSFLRRYIRAAQVGLAVPSLQLEFMGNYLAELTLPEYAFLKFLPSEMAASAVFLAKLTLFPCLHPWDPTLQYYTKYTPSQLKECVLALYELQRNSKGCTLPAIRDKYRQPKFKSVSSIVPPVVIDPSMFLDVFGTDIAK